MESQIAIPQKNKIVAKTTKALLIPDELVMNKIYLIVGRK